MVVVVDDGPETAVPTLVEAVDVFPTLLECAGIPVPGHLQGRSLWPALQGQPLPGRTSALTEHHGWKTLRTERHRYLIEADGHERLFDLERDAAGYVDAAGQPGYAEELAAHRHELLRRLLAMERPLSRVWPY